MAITEWSFGLGSSNLLFFYQRVCMCVCPHEHVHDFGMHMNITVCIWRSEENLWSWVSLFTFKWILGTELISFIYFICPNVEVCFSAMLFLLFGFWNII